MSGLLLYSYKAVNKVVHYALLVAQNCAIQSVCSQLSNQYFTVATIYVVSK